MHRNTHSRCLEIADDRRAAFSIILVGNQIAEIGAVAAVPGHAGCDTHISWFCGPGSWRLWPGL
jgi:hypothetical protein